jgi:hypothetical protein
LKDGALVKGADFAYSESTLPVRCAVTGSLREPLLPMVASRFSKRHCRMAKAMLAFGVAVAFIGASGLRNLL